MTIEELDAGQTPAKRRARSNCSSVSGSSAARYPPSPLLGCAEGAASVD
jgi:hypothetical protein